MDDASTAAVKLALLRLQQMGPTVSFTALLSSSWHDICKCDLSDSAIGEAWAAILAEDPNSETRLMFGSCLRQFDDSTAYLNGPATPRRSEERRRAIYRALELQETLWPRLDKEFPLYSDTTLPVVVAKVHVPWYSVDRCNTGFYWQAYKRYLIEVGKWVGESVTTLDTASTEIVQRLSEPARREVFPTKGLVVGYVQSGKTANFTAVIAKAADAGYRLIVVLAGMLELLRKQTQRRIDKELVGRELIQKHSENEYDYMGDEDWMDFASHAGHESDAGYFEWERVTRADVDYHELRQDVRLLKFAKSLPGRPFNDPINLRSAPAKLIVVKKNAQRLAKLVRDLKRIRNDLDDVPALIIDDESDQASLHTGKPSIAIEKQRKGVNAEIVKLLRTLPRAQYIGYTATPFANVFVDPTDPEDLFPKDYIIALGKPDGYMGVRDFFDLADDLSDLQESEKPDGRASKEAAYVREVKGADEAKGNLGTAIDSFILSGAIKLFRQSVGYPIGSSRHHTMLVHVSTQMAKHDEQYQLVQALFVKAIRDRARLGGRLRNLWATDYLPTTEAQNPSAPTLDAYERLEPFVDECIGLISASGRPIRVVNSDPKHEAALPNFDQERVWSILVGGSKLSRGYTVEGLTISYFRRDIKTADTLMQVGRWFGFRRGYVDLVRLFISGDLYEAFKSVCRDEEVFRRELRRYVDQSYDPPILPIQVPPLVTSHLLLPTSKTKMQNTFIKHRNFGGEWKEHVALPDSDDKRRDNCKLFRDLLNLGLPPTKKRLGTADAALTSEARGEWNAWTSLVPKKAFITFLKRYKWDEGVRPLQLEFEFLEDADLDSGVDTVLVVLPQKAKDEEPRWKALGSLIVSVFERKRTKGFKGISEQRHRKIAEHMAGVAILQLVTKDTAELASKRQAVMIVYPIKEGSPKKGGELDDRKTSIGFGIQYPGNKIRSIVTFGVRNIADGEAPFLRHQ